MKKYAALITIGALLALSLNSCDTYMGQGAGIGALVGAFIGGHSGGHHHGHHHHGSPEGALAGAAIGAAAGALIGAAIDENEARRYREPRGGFPVARYAGRRGFYYSPYTGRVYDLRGVPPGELTRDVDNGRLFRRP